MNAQELFDAFRDVDPAWLREADQLADRAAEHASHSEIQEDSENEIQKIFAQHSECTSRKVSRIHTETPDEPGQNIFADLTGSDAGLPVQMPAEHPAERSSKLFYRIGGIAAAVAIFTVGAFAVSVITSRGNEDMSTMPAAQPSDPDTVSEIQDDAADVSSYHLIINGEDHKGECITYSTEVDTDGSTRYYFTLDGQEFDLKSGEDFQLYANDGETNVRVFGYLRVPKIDVSCFGGSLMGQSLTNDSETQHCTITCPEQTPIELTLKPTVSPGRYYPETQVALSKAIEDGSNDNELLNIMLEQTNLRTNRPGELPAVISKTEAGCNYKISIYQDGKQLDITDPDTGEAVRYYQYALTENLSENTKNISFTPLPTGSKESGSRIEIHVMSMLPDGTYVGNTPHEFRLITVEAGTPLSISNTYESQQ